jgi:ribonuclease E
MLIDASHPEETRVVVVDGTKLTEFDFETASRKPLKGNIYLAKVIRIEPSLQAAFVEYGGNRHGFLAFSEIHPDYFQIPVADREKLLAEQQRLAEEEAEQRPSRGVDRTDIEEAREEAAAARLEPTDEPVAVEPSAASAEEQAVAADIAAVAPTTEVAETTPATPAALDPIGEVNVAAAAPADAEPEAGRSQAAEIPAQSLAGPAEPAVAEAEAATAVEPGSAEAVEPAVGEATEAVTTEAPATEDTADAAPAEAAPVVEVLGGDDAGEEQEKRERRRRQPVRQYKIQEVLKRRQILLVQVVKEERGNKGAALTTYLSLAGRYCVLMPNAGRGGGISRKISNPNDRKRMKEILAELDVPQGMGVILRTAGLERSNLDIKRDYEYLIRLWDSIRELTMRSTAPALIYEEGDLIKRSLRDVFDTDIAQVLVEGEAGYQAASEFMRQLIPHQADKVQPYKEPIPLFHRYQVESQFDAMHLPTVQLRSGGYIVINPTEALVAIDVNSGRSTKERNIEETALRTNLEAAEEVARQVRLRDLAGLIVVDFIDMEENRHQRQVEHKMKDAMRNDRARIQIGRISAFGLLEMSRQRLRPSLLEHSTESCPHCAGTGRVRSIESAALHALRAIEEEGVRRRSSEIVVSVPPNVALYLLNQKRHALSEIERRYAFQVTVEADDELHAADCEIERVRQRRDDHRPTQELARATYEAVEDEPPADDGDEMETGPEADRSGAAGEEDADSRGRRRRRRRRRSRRDGDEQDRPSGDGDDRPSASAEIDQDAPPPDSMMAIGEHAPAREDALEPESEPVRDDEGEGRPSAEGQDEAADRDDGDRRRRRGRRGGRRRRRENEGDVTDGNGWDRDAEAAPAAVAPESHETQPATPLDGQPVEQMPEAHMPIEQAPFQPHAARSTEAVAPSVAPPPPAIEPPPVPVVAQAPQPVPEPIEPPPPPPPPPTVIPTISADAPPEKPKRGWWRR